jgi:quinol monooxygenase YgiN
MIGYLIELTINDDGLDTFKELATGYATAVNENEPNTLTYQWYLSEDNSTCLLHESFTDSEALLQHLANVGPSLPNLLAVAPITRVEVFGVPSDAAREALDGLGASYFPHFTGFHR